MASTAAISLTLPVSQAAYRVKRLLFQPFDPGKWLVIGFCAWLAELGRGGIGGAGPPKLKINPGAAAATLQQWLEQARSYISLRHLWIVPVAALAAVAGLAFWAVILWISSRGQFMFLYCLAFEKAEVRAPWTQYARPAWSLFLFRLVLTMIAAALTFPAVVGFIVFLAPLLPNSGVATTIFAVLTALALAFLVIVFAFVWFLISKLTTDFVVPIQFVRGCGCREAWSVLIELIARNADKFVLYLLFQLVLWMAIYAALTVIVLLTCCVAGCLLALPYIGTVLFLPALAFQRAYSIHYLSQFGPNLSPT